MNKFLLVILGPLAVSAHTERDLDMELGKLIEDGLDGFLIVVSFKGRMLYVSENVTALLGFQSVSIKSHKGI